MLFATRSCALSSSIPVWLAGCFSKICPPNGFGVFLSILAILSAAELATEAWPSARVRNTGLLGAILSRSWRVGNCGGFQNVSIQPRPVIHLPGPGFVDASFHPRQKVFKRICTFQIQSHFALADSEDVAMRIGEAGHDRATAKIDNLRGMKFLRVFV